MKQLLAVTLLIIGVALYVFTRPRDERKPAEQPTRTGPAAVPEPARVAAVPTREAGAGSPARAACGLKVTDVPAIGGLRLGMSAEQVLALFPGSKEDPEVRSALSRPASALGTSSLTVKPDKSQSKEQYAGVSRIELGLLDGRVSSFTLHYNGPEWPHVDKFVEKFVGGTNLPAADAWEAYPGMDTQLKVLTCEGVELRVFAGGEGGNLNYVLVSDLEAARTLKERRVKAREKAGQQSKS